MTRSSQDEAGAYLVNTARGRFGDPRCDRAGAGERQLAGTRATFGFPAAGSEGYPWRTMPHHGMTPHCPGRACGQARYAAGVREILRSWFEGVPFARNTLIVAGGQLRGPGRIRTALAT